MLKEQITKQFLLEISKEKGVEEFGFSMLSIFIRRPVPSSVISSPITEDNMVEPEVFLDSVIKAAKSSHKKAYSVKDKADNVIQILAKRILYVIECDLKELPKYINDPHVSSIARWRLKNGM